MTVEYLTGDRRRAALASLRSRGLGRDDLTPALVLDQLTAERQGAGILRETIALRAVRAYYDRRPSTACWLYGPYGDGKSLALAYLVGRWPAATTAMATDAAPVLLREVDIPIHYATDRRRLREAPLLAIDEVGRWQLHVPRYAKKGYDPVASLRELLDARHEAGRATVFACNPPAGDRLKPPKIVTTRYGGALVNRWQAPGRHGPIEPWVDCGDDELRQDAGLAAWREKFRRLAEQRLEQGDRDETPLTPERAAALLARLGSGTKPVSKGLRSMVEGLRSMVERAARRSTQ